MFKSSQSAYTLTWIERINDIPASAWNALAKPLKTPFLEWEWLNNIETSGSATAHTGWQPCHLTVWRERELIACAALYLKNHSYGEFVFDQQWADVSHRLGIKYYPKMVGMTPFTPAVGYRFLIAPGEDETQLTALMLAEIERFCSRNHISGCHFLFVDNQWQSLMETQGFTSWLHYSYVWTNQNFSNFDDYLNMFNANQRRNIKKERQNVIKAELKINTLTGDEINSEFYPLIYNFYSSTCNKFYWGSKYLTRKFFQQLYNDYNHRVFLVTAHLENNPKTPIGLSFCIYKDDNLYGRYWGCNQEFDSLHFEACYYKPIEWAIAQGIKTFDPGAGGSHKKRRGFPATPNHSLHRFYHPRMQQILARYIEEINQMEQEEIDAINNELPFTKRELNLDI